MKDDFVYNNEDESDMGQLHAIHINLNAIAQVRAKLGHGVSLTHCRECSESIPEARRMAMPGCKTCLTCQELIENGNQ